MGSVFPQVLISKLSERWMSRLMPRMLALMAVQRQMAASRSRRPSSKAQQGVSGGVPITTPTSPLSTLAQIPSFRASMGQLPELGLAGVGVGVGFDLGWGQVSQPLTRANKTRLMERKRAADEVLLESISSSEPRPQCTKYHC